MDQDINERSPLEIRHLNSSERVIAILAGAIFSREFKGSFKLDDPRLIPIKEYLRNKYFKSRTKQDEEILPPNS